MNLLSLASEIVAGAPGRFELIRPRSVCFQNLNRGNQAMSMLDLQASSCRVAVASLVIPKIAGLRRALKKLYPSRRWPPDLAAKGARTKIV